MKMVVEEEVQPPALLMHQVKSILQRSTAPLLLRVMYEWSLAGKCFSENKCGEKSYNTGKVLCSHHFLLHTVDRKYSWSSSPMSPFGHVCTHKYTVPFRRLLSNSFRYFQSMPDTPKTHEELYTDWLLWTGGDIPVSYRPICKHSRCLPAQQHNLYLSAWWGVKVIRFVCAIQYSVTLVTRVRGV